VVALLFSRDFPHLREAVAHVQAQRGLGAASVDITAQSVRTVAEITTSRRTLARTVTARLQKGDTVRTVAHGAVNARKLASRTGRFAAASVGHNGARARRIVGTIATRFKHFNGQFAAERY